MSLQKLANHEALTQEDIIVAAREYSDLEKQAADADAYGRSLAHQYVEKLAAEAEESEKEETEEEKKEREKKEKEGKEKVSSSNEIENAFAVLRANGLLK